MAKRSQLYFSSQKTTNVNSAWTKEDCGLPVWGFMRLQLGKRSHSSYSVGNVLMASKKTVCCSQSFLRVLEFFLHG